MPIRVQDSFGAICTSLEKPKIARRAIAFVLFIHAILLGYSAYVHSPTLNEPGHLVAGLSYWKFGRFDIYNVNPPLVKMVAALPVIAVGYNEDWSSFYSGPGTRAKTAMGQDFMVANGEQLFFLFMIARWACIPFSYIGAIVCYLWARDLYGRPAGVLACTIWCFEPNILAHGSLITMDAHAAALGLAACYTFWRWLKRPSWTQTVVTGIVLGFAELAKTTLIVLYPLWPLMWLVYRWPDRHFMRGHDWLREAGMLFARMVIGLYVLNLGYGFEDSFMQLKDFHFVSNLFTGNSPPKHSSQIETRNPRYINRFGNSWLGYLPVPFPRNYVQGIDSQQHDFEDYFRPSYLRGEWRSHGWWYYYLYACAIKLPLGLWLLGLIAIGGRIIDAVLNFTASRVYRPNATSCSAFQVLSRDELMLLAPAASIFFIASLKTGFCEHMRYVLPSFPYLFIFISRFPPNASLTNRDDTVSCRKSASTSRYQSVPPFVALLSLFAVAWLLVSSLSIYPHSLSYFNESVGGPLNGSKHLLGSNIDWGQDFRYLKWWVEANPELYTGTRPLSIYHYHSSLIGDSDLGSNDVLLEVPDSGAAMCLDAGWYAVSSNLLHGAPGIVKNRAGMRIWFGQGTLVGFQSIVPQRRIAYSILIFRICEK